MEAGRLSRGSRGESGETLAFLVLWPTLIVAILLLLVHTFIVVNAQSEAEVAASAGLRAAWRAAAASDFRTEVGGPNPYTDDEPHPSVAQMADSARNAAAEAAGAGEGWRWWTPDSTEVSSDWCSLPAGRPAEGQAGWVQVRVEGEVIGPMAALWPGRLDRVYAVAYGPADLSSSLELQIEEQGGRAVPSQALLTVC